MTLTLQTLDLQTFGPNSPSFLVGFCIDKYIQDLDSLILYAEDPTILSGTLRSTLDVFDEYEDVEIVSFHPLYCHWY